jgi:hypothetical protein
MRVFIHYYFSVMDYICLSCKSNFAEVAHTKVEDISLRPVNFRQTKRLHSQQNYRFFNINFTSTSVSWKSFFFKYLN